MKTIVLNGPPAPGQNTPQRPGPLMGGPAPPGPPQMQQPRPPQLTRAAPVVASSKAGPHPLMDAMHAAYADLLTLASQLEQGATPPPPEALRRQITEMISEMENKARLSGIALEDARDAAYAVMALFDEILIRVNWPGQRDWKASPLQFVYFRENTAGQNFFARAEVLMSQPHRAHVLYIYFCALALGFQGRYAVGDMQGLQGVLDIVGRTVAMSVVPSEPASPHGEPEDVGKAQLKREKPIILMGLGILAGGLLIFFALRMVLSLQVGSAVGPMHDYSAGSDRGRR